jgi:hypothetical protein
VPSAIDNEESSESSVCGDGTCPSEAIAVADCPSGEAPVGGGWLEDSSLSTFANNVVASLPVLDTSTNALGWAVDLIDTDKVNGGFFAEATCEPVSGAAAAKAMHSAMPLGRLEARVHSR